MEVVELLTSTCRCVLPCQAKRGRERVKSACVCVCVCVCVFPRTKPCRTEKGFIYACGTNVSTFQSIKLSQARKELKVCSTNVFVFQSKAEKGLTCPCTVYMSSV